MRILRKSEKFFKINIDKVMQYFITKYKISLDTRALYFINAKIKLSQAIFVLEKRKLLMAIVMDRRIDTTEISNSIRTANYGK
jgi:hypothetical protein